MAKLDESDVRRIVRQTLQIPGVGVIWDGNLRFSNSPCSEFCNEFRDTYGRDKCANFYRDLDESGMVEKTTCPGGFTIAYASLTHASKTRCGVSVHISCAANSDPGSLQIGTKNFARRTKKAANRILSTLPTWTNPHAHTILESLQLLQNQVDDDRRAREDQVFAQTLVRYKDFVASFSHEALSPIQEVRALLERAHSRPIDPGNVAVLSTAILALDKVRTSLEGMRLLFNPEQRPIANQLHPCDIKSIAEGWVRVYQEEITEKNVRIIYDPPCGPWQVQGVKEYLEVMMRNLVSNAVKYAFSASGRVEPGKIVLRFEGSRRQKAFSIINFGVPIPPEDIESRSIFKLSQRSGTAGDRGRTGRGVGLYLVELVAKLHGGTVDVRSEPMNPGYQNQYSRNEFTIRIRG